MLIVTNFRSCSSVLAIITIRYTLIVDSWVCNTIRISFYTQCGKCLVFSPYIQPKSHPIKGKWCRIKTNVFIETVQSTLQVNPMNKGWREATFFSFGRFGWIFAASAYFISPLIAMYAVYGKMVVLHIYRCHYVMS